MPIFAAGWLWGCWWGAGETLGASISPIASAGAAVILSALSFLAPQAALPALSFLTATIAGATCSATTAGGSPADILEEHPRGLNEVWRVRGWLATDPESADDAALVELSVAHLYIDGNWQPWRARLSVTVYEKPPEPPADPWRAGDRFEAFLKLREDRPPANPGSWARDRLRARGLDLRSSLKSFDQLRPRGRPPPFAPQRWAAALRQGLRSHIEQRLPHHEEVIRALLLGERAGLDGQMTAMLARSGLIHLLAISGLHVGLALGAAYALGRACGLPRPGAALIAGTALVGIVIVVVSRAPVLRAALMASASLAAVVQGRRSAPLNGWAFAVICLTLRNPMAVRDFGFQLSAAATLGILLMVPAIDTAMERSHGKITGYVKALILTSFAAQVSVTPFLAAHTHRVPLGALLLNLAAIPVLTITLASASLALLLSVLGLFWLGGAVLAEIAEAGIGLILSIAEVAEVSSKTSLVVPAGRAAYLAGMAFLILLSVYQRGRTRVAVAALALVFLVLGAWPIAPPGQSRLVMLDVGQGDALLFWPAGGDPLMIDSGGSPGGGFDTGTAIVAPALRGMGVRHLRSVVISHLHADHAGGVPGLLREVSTTEIWASSLPEDLPLAREIRDAGRGAAIKIAGAGDRGDFAGCTWRVLHPRIENQAHQTDEGLNDSSLVLGLHCGRRHLLLTGDSEKEAEEAWGPAAGPFARGILKLAHHGSRTSTSALLLEQLAPRVALISVGWRNRFGFPHKPVLERLRARGTPIYRTDRDGAISVNLGRRITVRGERWTSGES